MEATGARAPLDPREWRRIGGINRRAFTARVLGNDTTARELTLSIEDPGSTKTTQLHYELILPYTQMMRIAVLVHGARTLTVAEEQKFRRKHRANSVHKQYFHPFDRFEAVTLV